MGVDLKLRSFKYIPIPDDRTRFPLFAGFENFFFPDLGGGNYLVDLYGEVVNGVGKYYVDLYNDDTGDEFGTEFTFVGSHKA